MLDRAVRSLCLAGALMLVTGCGSDTTEQPAQSAESPDVAGATLEAKQAACEGGDLLVCTELGTTHVRENLTADEEVGLRYLRKACDGKVAAACFELGLHLMSRGFRPETEQAFGKELVDQACEDRHGEACLFLGEITAGVILRNDVEPDADEARNFYRQACQYGEAEGCEKLARPIATP